MKTHKKDHPQAESTASKLLSLISEGETGYIHDWARINDMRNKTEPEEKKEVSTENKNQKNHIKKKESGDYVSRKTMNNFGHRKVHSFTANKKTEQNFKALSPRKISFLREYNSRLNEQSEVEKTVEKMLETKKHNNFLTQSCETQRLLNISRYETFVKYKSSNPQMNVESIRKVSLPWLTNENMKSCSFLTENSKNQTIENPHRISELIRNKIKKKRNEKSFTERSEIKTFVTEDNIQIPEPTSPLLHDQSVKIQLSDIQEQVKVKESKEIRLLKTWLDSNRFRNKRSVSSLLREHFENRYLDSKEQIGKKVIQTNTKPMNTTIMKFRIA